MVTDMATGIRLITSKLVPPERNCNMKWFQHGMVQQEKTSPW